MPSRRAAHALLAAALAAAIAATACARRDDAASAVRDAAEAASLDGLSVAADPAAPTAQARLAPEHAAPWHRIAAFLLAATRDRGLVVRTLRATPMRAAGSAPKPLAGGDASSPLGCSGDVYRDWTFEALLEKPAVAPPPPPHSPPPDAAEGFFRALRALRAAPESASVETSVLTARAGDSTVDVAFALEAKEADAPWTSLRARVESSCRSGPVELTAASPSDAAGSAAELRLRVRLDAREPRDSASQLEPPVLPASAR